MPASQSSPSETVIWNGIEALEAGEFQVLAEGVARLLDPDHYANLVGTGRNFAHKTVPGWPDGWSEQNAFEASHSTDLRLNLII